jgi:ketosteroid isomerase-like protein
MKIENEEIVLLEERLKDAISASDINFLKEVLHDDLLFIAPNGTVVTKELDLMAHASGQMLVERITSTIEEIKVIEACAIAVVLYNTAGTMLGNKIDGHYRYIRVWKRCSDGIKIIAGSCVKV